MGKFEEWETALSLARAGTRSKMESMPAKMLTDIEARIMGSLVEKSSATPEQYPLSLNALTNACNQKTSRDPVMKLDEATVARAIATLQEKGLVGRRSEPGSRVTKFTHHVEN